MTDKERYATIDTWAEVFQEEGSSVSWPTIRRRLSKAAITGTTARNKTGRIVREGFYAESDVRKLCADLLRGLPQADEDGFFEQCGRMHGTISRLSRLFGISDPSIKSRIQKAHLKPTRGKIEGGSIRDFYSLFEVRNICSDLLQYLPCANEEGLIEKDGETYGGMRRIAKLLGIAEKSCRLGIQKESVKCIQGKDKLGHIWDFYSLSDFRNRCADLLRDLPQTDEDGLIVQAGETYGTAPSFARLLGISRCSIKRRIDKSPLQSIQGKERTGRVLDYYSLTDVRKLCADLIAKRDTKA